MFDPQLIVAFLVGVALGAFYFGSLWWVVQQAADAQRPEFLLLAGFAVRAAVTLTGFFIVMGGRWERIVACMIGFLLARTVLVQLLRPSREPRKSA